MARYSIEDTTLTNIANAIRSKTGGTESIMVSDMPDQISSISGTKSWNDLEDRPFYDESVTIEWDGNTEGKVETEFEGISLVKVSDLMPERSDVLGGTIDFLYNGDLQTLTITEDMLIDLTPMGMPVFAICEGSVVIVYEPIPDTFDETGTYFMNMPDLAVNTKLTYSSIKKLDPQYLPEGGVGYEGVTDFGDTLTWDGKPTDTVVENKTLGLALYKVSDSTPTLDELTGGHVKTQDGIEHEITSDSVVVLSETVLCAVEAIFVVSTDNASCVVVGETLVFPNKGLYFSYANYEGTEYYLSQLTIPNYNFTKTEVHKIDPKYLPEGIGGLPPVTEADIGKVLTVNADGVAEWKDTEDGLSVTEITSPDDINADSPDGFYIQEGGSSTPSGGTTIHYYDSIDQVPADLPEGSYVTVPSEGAGGGGLPYVELTTEPTEDGAALTESENSALNAAYAKGLPVVVKFVVNEGEAVAVFTLVLGDEEVSYVYHASTVREYMLSRAETAWGFIVFANE